MALRRPFGSSTGSRRRLPTNKETVTSTAVLLFVSLLFVTAPSYFFLVTSWRSLIVFVAATVSLFFDLDEIASICPKFVLRIACWAWRHVEGKLLLGRRFVGRQWVELSVGNAESGTWKKKESLICRWSAKFGQRFGGGKLNEKEKEVLFLWLEKDRKKATRELEMTNDSAEHMAAMNFCYAMLRSEKKGKRVKVREQFQKSMKLILSKAKRKSGKKSKKKKTELEQKVPVTTTENLDASPRTKLTTEFSKSRSSKQVQRHRSLSWQGFDQEEVETVTKGSSKHRAPDVNDNALTIAQSQDSEDRSGLGDMNDNEGFEVIESKEYAAAKGRTMSGRLRNSRLKRLYSDSDVRDLLNNYEAGNDRAGKSSDISSALSLSFDGTDGDDSLTTASSMSASQQPDERQVTEEGKELNWLDVGAKIGIRILNSEKVKKAMANPATAEKLIAKGQGKVDLDKFFDKHSPIRPAGDRATSPSKEFSSPVEGDSSVDGNIITTPTSPCTMNSTSRLDTSSPLRKPVHAIWTSPGAAISPGSIASSSTLLSGVANLSANLDTDEDTTKEGHSCSSQEGDSHSCARGGSVHAASDWSVKWASRSPPSPLSPVAAWTKNESAEHKPCIPALENAHHRAHREDKAFRTAFRQVQPATTPRSTTSQIVRRRIIPSGVKMVIPICPFAPLTHAHHGRRRRVAHQSGPCHFQMATVVSSRRLYVPPPNAPNLLSPQHLNGYVYPTSSMDERKRSRQSRNNCLSITVQLDKSFLRGGKFAEMTVRVMDEWTGKYDMPRHSKYPIGSCVATSFGVGVLVGWRVEDDCHVVRSLWRRRGPGSAFAYFNRGSLHGVVEAAVGFRVETALGCGDVVAYVNGGPEFRRGKYFVSIRQRGRHQGEVLEFNRPEILSCKAAKFIPVIEQIRESAKYQIQVLAYKLMQRDRRLAAQGYALEGAVWNGWSHGFEVVCSSFIRAVEEDDIVNKWLSSFIQFLESVDFHGNLSTKKNELVLPDIVSTAIRDVSETEHTPVKTSDDTKAETKDDGAPPGLWFFDDLFGGGIFSKGSQEDDNMSDISSVTSGSFDKNALVMSQSSGSYANAYAFIRTVLRTVSIARASVPGRPNLQLGLSMCREVILFFRTVIKVQEKNMSPISLKAWKRTFEDIVATFGPLKQRLCKLGGKIAERLAEQGKIAKVRVINFVDILMIDDLFLQSLESGAWNETITRIQLGLVRAGIVDLKTSQQYLKTAKAIYNNLAPRTKRNKEAADRNGKKLANFAIVLKWLASPQRSFLSLFARDDVLELIERLMVRVYQKDAEACNMLNLYAFNFHSFRHLRILNNMAIAGKLWKPILDAADEEFSWAVSRMPENAREFIEPISKLFSLGVARFRQIKTNDLTSDWLDFLTETNAVKIIQQLDLKLILNLESFCNDLKEMMVVLPYYSSIDDDILKLMDEVDLEKILKEAAEALVDTDRFAHYIREKSAVAVKRFLDYLPKMSIPVEKRELEAGWVLTCRDKKGGDLRLSDVCIEREYMTCNVIGSGNVFSPVDLINDGLLSSPSWLSPSFEEDCSVEVSVLNDIADLIRNAQQHGSWQPGRGGIQQFAGKSVDPALDGLPVSEVLKCGIELWKNLEIDDEELMEIAIRDVSYQIQLQKDREEGLECVLKETAGEQEDISSEPGQGAGTEDESLLEKQISVKTLHDPALQNRRRFNPRKDPTVLFLEMKKVTCHLDEFLFRVEQKKHLTIYDPVFEGLGSLTIKNLSIRLRVECRKERINKLETEVSVPVLHLQELDIQLEKVKVKFKDTGADWLLNKVTRGFRDKITEIVATNVKEQIGDQIQVALEHLNSYIEVNPDLMLTILGITIDDLEENVIWV